MEDYSGKVIMVLFLTACFLFGALIALSALDAKETRQKEQDAWILENAE